MNVMNDAAPFLDRHQHAIEFVLSLLNGVLSIVVAIYQEDLKRLLRDVPLGKWRTGRASRHAAAAKRIANARLCVHNLVLELVTTAASGFTVSAGTYFSVTSLYLYMLHKLKSGHPVQLEERILVGISMSFVTSTTILFGLLGALLAVVMFTRAVGRRGALDIQ